MINTEFKFNTVLDKRDSFAPINCLLSGEELGESEFIKINKSIVSKVMRALRSDVKFINPNHIDFLSKLDPRMTAEDKKRNYKRLSKYFTTEFLNDPNYIFSFKKIVNGKNYHVCAGSLLFLITTALTMRNIRKDQSLVMTSNITRNVLKNNFDLDIPLIPFNFRNTFNFVLHLTNGDSLSNKFISLVDDAWDELPEKTPKLDFMHDNIILNFDSNFSSCIVNVFYRNKICVNSYSSDLLRIGNLDKGHLAFPNNSKSYSEMTFRDLDSVINSLENVSLDVSSDDFANLFSHLKGMYALKLLAVGLHTHKDIATPEVLKYLIDHSDLRKYPENTIPINKQVHTEEVIVNESESNSFRVVRMPQGSVKLIGFEIPENYDPDKKTTVPPSMRHYWVLNKDTGVKERVLRPCREHKRPSQYRKRLYEQQE